jgi:hypothetical protein
VTALDTAIEANCEKLYEVEGRIADAPVTFNAVAALLLIDVSYDSDRAASLLLPDGALIPVVRFYISPERVVWHDRCPGFRIP